MKYENFTDFVSNMGTDNNNIMSRWDELRKKNKKINLITILILLIIDILVLFILKISTNSIFSIIMADVFIYIIIYVIFEGRDISQFNNDYKENVISKMLENFITNLDYVPSKRMPSYIYDEAKYGGYYNKYSSDDYLEGSINGQKIIMADLLVQEETTHTDSDGIETSDTKTIFNGLFGKIELNKSINSNLKITRNHGISLFNKNKIEMDSYDFEKTFNVYSDNNIIAMQLLTADIQEDILDLYNKYKINFDIIVMNNKMYVLFNTGNMFEVFSNKKNPNEMLEKYFEIMKFIYKLVDKILKTIETTQI